MSSISLTVSSLYSVAPPPTTVSSIGAHSHLSAQDTSGTSSMSSDGRTQPDESLLDYIHRITQNDKELIGRFYITPPPDALATEPTLTWEPRTTIGATTTALKISTSPTSVVKPLGDSTATVAARKATIPLEPGSPLQSSGEGAKGKIAAVGLGVAAAGFGFAVNMPGDPTETVSTICTCPLP